MFFEVEEWEQEYLAKAFPHKNVLFRPHKAQEETESAALSASVVSTFIYSTLTAEVLGRFPHLKLIATRSTGFDHINTNYCKEKGITVMNVPTYGAHTVAEHTFALILAISRKLIPTVERSRRGNFSLDGLRGFDLAGKTIGVIGDGNIGSKVIQIALAFGMQVLVFTRHPGEQKENKRYVSLDELLRSSDIVTLHIPHNKETKHLINRNNIAQFKKGSILINTARGPLVETQAIVEGLQSGILRGAGLDVLEEECNLKEERQLLTDEFFKTCNLKTQFLNHVLLSRDDVLFTLHNAFNSQEALQQILHVTIENIQAFLAGKKENIVSA